MSPPHTPAMRMAANARRRAPREGNADGPLDSGRSRSRSVTAEDRRVPPVLRPLIVLPTYNEADNIAEGLRRARAAAPDAGILVVDDSSPDGTADIAKAMAGEVGAVDILSRPAKSGLGSAYREGFKWGRERGFDVLMEMDSDLSHDPADIPRLLRGIDDGADLVIGSRYVPGGEIPHWPWHRRALSKYGNRYSAGMLRID